MAVHLFGIRHHGPGSARHLLAALKSLRPSILLVEGPPEGEELLRWVADQGMRPPVAMLAFVPDAPEQSVFYPFAEFSPEWQAILYSLENKVPIRFMDMPLTHSLAKEVGQEGEAEDGSEPAISAPSEVPELQEVIPSQVLARHPMAHLADAAGVADEEEWWEMQFEMTHQPEEAFAAVAAAMNALRDTLPEVEDLREQRREAFMRRAIRQAERELNGEIAVVCGAWHVPALRPGRSQKEDDSLLKGLPKTKVETTWIPWTHDRLSFASGYGAGIHSPGWYLHCWQRPHDDGSEWLTHVARIFRRHKFDISSAHVIEAQRLATALAAMRGHHRPSLEDFNEATQSVMCMGDFVPLQVVMRELIVGECMGEVPEGAPMVPLQRDLDQQMRSLRLKASPDPKPLVLDLREEGGLARSILLHRLSILGVEWGKHVPSSGKGTFKEEWTLLWLPDHNIHLLEKAPWGNTIEAATNQYLKYLAGQVKTLPEITQLAERALPAELHQGVQEVMARMDVLASSTTDTASLMGALVPMVQIRKYGNVRGTDGETVAVILQSIFYRLLASLPMSCSGIDRDTSVKLAAQMRAVQRALEVLDEPGFLAEWDDVLAIIMGNDLASPLLRGTCCKLRYDSGAMEAEAAATAFGLALGFANAPADAAAWLEGFLHEAATVLLLDDIIWALLDNWVAGLDEDAFVALVPILRRTFANFASAERRQIAARARSGVAQAGSKAAGAGSIDATRAASVLPTLELLLGFVPSTKTSTQA